MRAELASLESRLQYRFSTPALLHRALTHSSLAHDAEVAQRDPAARDVEHDRGRQRVPGRVAQDRFTRRHVVALDTLTTRHGLTSGRTRLASVSSATTLTFLAQASRMAPAPVRSDMASTTSALPLTSPSVTARPVAGSFDLFA